MADNFSAPKPRSLPTPTNVQDVSRTLASWKTQLGPLISNANPPKPPVNFRVTNARGGLQLSWSPVDGSQGYEILKSLNGSFTDDLTVIPVNGVNNTNFFDNLGGSATTAHYKLRSTTGDPQRGPETGTVSHTSLDANDTSSTPITFADQFTSDHTRANARLGNYGAIRSSGLGVSSGGSISVASAGTTGASSTQPAPLPSATSVPFSVISSGENISAAMVVGQDASITPDPTIPGVISATHIQGNLATTAIPADGNVLVWSASDGQYDLPTNILVNPSASGNVLQVGPTTNVGYLTLETPPVIYSENTQTGTIGGTRGPFTIPYDFSTYLNPASASAIECFNVNALLAIQPACAQNFTSELCGFHGEGDHNGSGTVAVLIGVAAEAYNLGSGTVTHLSGSTSEVGTLNVGSGPIVTADAYQALVTLANNSTITNLYGFHFTTPGYGTGLTISGTVAAIQIDDPTGGGTVAGALGINVSTAVGVNHQLGTGNTTVGALTFNNATIGAPTGSPAIRCGNGGNDRIAVSSAGNDYFFFNMHLPATNGGTFNLGANAQLGWASGTANSVTSDTSISRIAAASIAIGNGTQGNTSGTVNATIYTGPLNTSLAQLGSATGAASSPTYQFLGTNGATSGMYFQNGNGLGFAYVGNFALGLFSSYAEIPNGSSYAWTSALNANPDTGISRVAATVVAVGNSSSGNTTGVILANGGYGVSLKSTSAITGPAPVKADTSNANQIVQTTTTDTGAGAVIGVCINSPGAGANGQIITTGVVALTLGTGTASIGQFVIVDTTTNGRVKCTSTYTAGTVIGVAMAAQSTVGSTFNVLIGLR